MRKFASFLLFSLIALFAFCSPSPAAAAPSVPSYGFVRAASAILYDMDNEAILFEQNADQRIPPASLTKILSMFLAFDFIRDGHAELNSPVNISRAAARTGGSRMGLRAGETVPLDKLLLGVAVSSGNDASHALAEFVGGSVPDFVKMMNERARQLGMHDSHFSNPHGMPDKNQYTTARDMLIAARAYLMAHPDCLAFHNTKTLGHNGNITWNKNPLLGQYPGADGLKSGWIRASGYNLIFTAKKGSKRLLAVIMGAPDMFSRSNEAGRLLDAGFLVCDNNSVSVAAALDTIPRDSIRIDPQKTGRDAGLLKKRSSGRKTLLAKRNKKGRQLYAQKGKSLHGKNSVKRRTAYMNTPRKNHAARQARQAKHG